MRYYVIAPDGQKYGPVDTPTLNEWVLQGRVLPEFVLEEETTGRRVAPMTVPGINWNVGQPGSMYPPASAQPNYYAAQPAGNMRYGNPNRDLNNAWIWAILSISCCPIIGGIMGIIASIRVKDSGNSAYLAPLIISIIGLVASLGILGRIH